MRASRAPLHAAGRQGVRALGCVVLVLATSLTCLAQSLPQPTSDQAKQPAARAQSGPAWGALSASQQAALRPLATVWKDIDANRKRKWIALSDRFSALSPVDQATLHARMKNWASLSAAERNRARLNFAQTRELSSEDRKARWEAYQALSPQEKSRLAAQAPKLSGAAPAVARKPAGKLAAVPTTRSERKPSKTRPARPASPAASAGASSP